MKTAWWMVAALMLLALGIGFFLGSHFHAVSRVEDEVDRPYALDLLNSVLWMQTAAERRALTRQTYRQAEPKRPSRMGAGPPPSNKGRSLLNSHRQ